MATHLILIDALNLIRRVFAVQERPFIHDKSTSCDDLTEKTQQQILLNTKNACLKSLAKIIAQHQPSHALAVFDSQSPCWRYKLYPDYKKGRKKMPNLLANNLADIQDAFMQQGVDSLVSEEDEADDIIATLAIKLALKDQHSTIISTDKGFLSLLSPQVNVYDHFNRRFLDEEYVLTKFKVKSNKLVDFWTLTGDNTNKIPGVAGIGPVTAANLINEYGSLNDILSATDLTSSIKNKLAEHQEEIKLSQQLLILKKDIPLGFNLKDLRINNDIQYETQL